MECPKDSRKEIFETASWQPSEQDRISLETGSGGEECREETNRIPVGLEHMKRILVLLGRWR